MADGEIKKTREGWRTRQRHGKKKVNRRVRSPPRLPFCVMSEACCYNHQRLLTEEAPVEYALLRSPTHAPSSGHIVNVIGKNTARVVRIYRKEAHRERQRMKSTGPASRKEAFQPRH